MNLIVHYLRSIGYLVFTSDTQAVDHVRSLGFRAYKPVPSPTPVIGSRWQPTRGTGKNGAARKLSPRWIVGVGENDVFYALTQDGAGIAIDKASWDRWVRKTKAEVGK